MEVNVLERYNSRTIDELGRLGLHSELRQRLDLKPGGMVSLKIIDEMVILQHEENFAEFDGVICEINDLGMITVPTQIRDVLGWKEKDKISFHHTNDVIILNSAG